MRKLASFTLATVAAGGMLFQSNCSAIIYDAAADFSLSSNPNGAWSYGYSTTPGGAMVLDGENYQHSSGLYVWRKSLSGQNGPNLTYNPTASTITVSGQSDLMIWNPYQLSLHPGSGGEFSIIRFSAPESSQYQVEGAFSSVDHYYGATTDVHILQNGVSVYDGTVQGITSICSFDQAVQLNQGDLLDFVVGMDGYWSGWDNTGLDARVIPVPEPSVIGLLVPSLWLFRRFRSRQ